MDSFEFDYIDRRYPRRIMEPGTDPDTADHGSVYDYRYGGWIKAVQTYEPASIYKIDVCTAVYFGNQLDCKIGGIVHEKSIYMSNKICTG